MTMTLYYGNRKYPIAADKADDFRQAVLDHNGDSFWWATKPGDQSNVWLLIGPGVPASIEPTGDPGVIMH